MRIGYARVSTTDQDMSLQRDALNAAGCDRIIEDTASGAKAQRQGLEKLFDLVRKGDTVTVWRLDRLGRSLPELIAIANRFQEAGVGLHSLNEQIDTSSPGGKFIFHVFGALSEFERNLIIERTTAGLRAARERGRKGGRKPALSESDKERLYSLRQEGRLTDKELQTMFKISRPVFYRALREIADKKAA